MPDIYDLSNVGSDSAGSPRRSAADYAPEPPKGTGYAIDEVAKKLVSVCCVVGGIAFLYLMWGVFGGSWASPSYNALTHDDRLRILGNIATFSFVLKTASIVGIVSLLICAFRDEYVGYVLAGVGIFFYTLVEILVGLAFDMRGMRVSSSTTDVFTNLRNLAFFYGFPGSILIIVDFARRFKTASDNAAMQRAVSKYGKDVKQEVKHGTRNVFSRCWELPYCRDHVKVKCPVYINRRGPCWWHKQGCMCEERIVLQSVIDSNWREKSQLGNPASKTSGASLSDGMSTQHYRVLSPAAKRERCRNCVIYNEHERQKYKALVTLVMVSLAACLVFFAGQVQDSSLWLLASLERITEKLSFGGNSGGGISFLHGNPSPLVEWMVVFIVCLFALSFILRFIEYCCFKIKI